MPRFRILAVAAGVVALATVGFGAVAQDKKTDKAPAKPPSPCKGLDEAACKAKADVCIWITPKAAGKKAYCRKKTGGKKKTDGAPKPATPK